MGDKSDSVGPSEYSGMRQVVGKAARDIVGKTLGMTASLSLYRTVGSGAAGAAWAAPLFWPLTPFDYERAGGLHQLGTKGTLLRCTGSVELLCLSSETRSRSVLGLRGRNQSHPFFSARTLSYVSESVDTL